MYAMKREHAAIATTLMMIRMVAEAAHPGRRARVRSSEHGSDCVLAHTQGAPSGLWPVVSVPIGGPSTSDAGVDDDVAARHGRARSGRGRAAPGHPASRRPGCTSTRGTGTRTTASCRTTGHGSRGARTSGTARRSPASIPAMIGGVYAGTFFALGRSSFGIGDDVGLRRRRCRTGSCCRRRPWRRPRSRPSTLPPKPPLADGQRNASAATPNAPSPRPEPARIDAVEELAAGDAELVEVDRLVDRRGRRGAGLGHRGAARLDRLARLVGPGPALAGLLDRARLVGRRRALGHGRAAAGLRRACASRDSAAPWSPASGRSRGGRRPRGPGPRRWRWRYPRLAPTARRRCRRSRGSEVEPGAPEERADDDEHRPHHHEQREDRDRELAVLGLCSTGSCRRTARPSAGTGAMPGMVTPATIGWNIVSSSCSPRKYHGAFDGFGVLLKSARPSSGARTSAEKMVSAAVTIRIAANSIDEQVRPGVHLVLRLGAGLLDRPRLDHREQPLRVTAGAGGRCGAGSVAVAAAAAPVPAAATSPPPPPAARTAALRPLEQVGGDLGAALGRRRPRAAGVGRRRGGRLGRGRVGRGLARARRRRAPRPRRPLRRARGGRAPCGAPCCAGGGVRGSRPSCSSPPTAARRCRRPCGRARSGRP